MLDEVIFKTTYTDKDTGEEVEKTYRMSAKEFAFIMKSKMSWGQFYPYLNSIGEVID